MLRALVGIVFVLAGSAGLLGLLYVTWNHSPAAEHLLFRIGLAGSAILSGLAQVLMLVGAWMVWTALQRARGRA